ncbi:MAG: hypothetical protein JST00_02645 [Deltaproteobacteria bacterium]|nr:hypothetical protein [Deltaproteobacteria bacterium]
MSQGARRASTPEEEADHLIALYEGNAAKILDILHGQLTNLTGRAQMLLQLAGLTITVTGFSGASIARSGKLAAVLVVSGLVTVLVAASLSMGGILRIRWMTQLAPTTLRDTVIRAIEMRDSKTRVFGRSLALLIVGLALYIGSVSMLLLGNVP